MPGTPADSPKDESPTNRSLSIEDHHSPCPAISESDQPSQERDKRDQMNNESSSTPEEKIRPKSIGTIQGSIVQTTEQKAYPAWDPALETPALGNKQSIDGCVGLLNHAVLESVQKGKAVEISPMITDQWKSTLMPTPGMTVTRKRKMGLYAPESSSAARMLSTFKNQPFKTPLRPITTHPHQFSTLPTPITARPTTHPVEEHVVADKCIPSTKDARDVKGEVTQDEYGNEETDEIFRQLDHAAFLVPELGVSVKQKPELDHSHVKTDWKDQSVRRNLFAELKQEGEPYIIKHAHSVQTQRTGENVINAKIPLQSAFSNANGEALTISESALQRAKGILYSDSAKQGEEEEA